MKSANRRTGFTLIEILIVVIIMALLAATIIPQFSQSTTDAQDSTLRFNLHTIRSQLELYKMHHLNQYPELAEFERQMTEKTNVNGLAGPDPIYGPYIQGDIPMNPFNNSNEVVAVATPGTEPAAIVAGGAGWQYDESIGGFYPNNPEFYAP